MSSIENYENAHAKENHDRGDHGDNATGKDSAFHLSKDDLDIVKNTRNDNTTGNDSGSDNSNSSQLPKLAIVKLSTELVGNEKMRDNFVKDPAKFIETRVGNSTNETDEIALSGMPRMLFADGYCCGGCVC